MMEDDQPYERRERSSGRLWRHQRPPLSIPHSALLDDPSLDFGPPCVCGREEESSIYGFGNPDADVMLVGIAPGKNEHRWGIPMVGATGERGDKILRAVKYDRRRTYATNLCCWWNDNPTKEEVAECWPRLKEEIETVRPQLVIALGALASEWLTGYPIGKARGAMLWPQHNQSPAYAELDADCRPVVMPTWHPAASLRVASLATDILRDFRKIKPFLRGKLNPLKWDHTVVTDRADAQRVLDSLAGREVAIDVETEDDSTDSFQRIVCVAIAVRVDDPEFEHYQAWVFPAEILEGLRWPDFLRVWEHNMQFDNPALWRRYGVWLPRVHDSMLYSWSRDERPGRDEEGAADRSRSGEKSKPRGPGYHGLKPLSAEYMGAGVGYGDAIKKTLGKSFDELRAPQLIPLTEEEIARSGLSQPVLDGRRKLAMEVDQPATALLGAPYHDEEQPASQVSDGDVGAVEGVAGSKKKKAKKKPTIPTRLETNEEAAARFATWLESLHRYNAFDAVNTIALPTRALGVGPSCPAFEKYIVPSAQMFARMHLWGVPVDLERARELQADWEPWITSLTAMLQQEAFDYGYRNEPKLKRDQKAKAEFEAEWGTGTWQGEPLNLASFVQLGRFLYGTLRQKVTVRTPTGKPSTGEEAIQNIDHPFVERLTELSTAEHVKASHLDPIVKLARPDEAGWNRVHAHIWVNGAVSARRSISGPPFQQYPNEHPAAFWKRLAEVRSVVAPPPGYSLLEADLKQVELWGAALLSGDPVLLEDLQTGDYHTKQVRETFLCDAEEGTVLFTHMRLLAKRFNFSVIYKVEQDTLAKLMNEAAREAGIETRTTPAQAERLIRAWYRRNRVFYKWQQNLVREVQRTGKMTNAFGFVRRLPLYDSMLDKQICNWPIQSTCGYLVVLAAMELERPFQKLDTHLLFDTHDSLLVECPTENVPAVAGLMHTAMSKSRIEGWPSMGVEFKHSAESWRRMKDYKIREDVAA